MQSIRSLIRLIEAASQDGAVTYYMHLTRLENLPSIQEHGLIPNHGGGNYDDQRWVSLEGVYATQNYNQLENYINGHDIGHYALLVIAVGQHETISDEDYIDINIAHAFKNATSGMDTEEIEELSFDVQDTGQIDFSNPVWASVRKEFASTLGPPAGAGGEALINDVIDCWFDLESDGGGEAIVDWEHTKDKFTRMFPHMHSASTGRRESIRIPTTVGFEGEARIIAAYTVTNDGMENEAKSIYDKIPPEDRAAVNEMVKPLL